MKAFNKQDALDSIVYDGLKRSSYKGLPKFTVYFITTLAVLSFLNDISNSSLESPDISWHSIYIFMILLVGIASDRQTKINRALVAELERIKKLQGIE